MEEHLKWSGREIALPIEARALLLLETSMKEEVRGRVGLQAMSPCPEHPTSVTQPLSRLCRPVAFKLYSLWPTCKIETLFIIPGGDVGNETELSQSHICLSACRTL